MEAWMAGRKRRQRNAELVQKAIDSFAEKLEGDDVKASIGDFIRLMQLQQEMDEEQPDEIRVIWVEANEFDGAR